MPHRDHDRLAAIDDFASASRQRRNEMAEFRDEMAGFRDEMAKFRRDFKSDLDDATRVLLATQFLTTATLCVWISAVI